MIGIGGTDALVSLDAAGLRYALGEIGTDAVGDVGDAASGLEAGAGAVAAAPAPASGWR